MPCSRADLSLDGEPGPVAVGPPRFVAKPKILLPCLHGLQGGKGIAEPSVSVTVMMVPAVIPILLAGWGLSLVLS